MSIGVYAACTIPAGPLIAWRWAEGEQHETHRTEGRGAGPGGTPAAGQQGADTAGRQIASRAVFVCAHGAGGHKDDRSMLRLEAALTPQGFALVRFNFPYRDKGSARIDPMPILKSAFLSVVEKARLEKGAAKLVIGGRSMGGRVASMLAAEGLACDGLLLAAYPLHPAGQAEKLRDAHLAALRAPVLCLNGTRDPLCRRDLMEGVLEKLSAPWQMHWLEGADHSFRVLKSSGRSDADVDAEVGEAAGRWLASL